MTNTINKKQTSREGCACHEAWGNQIPPSFVQLEKKALTNLQFGLIWRLTGLLNRLNWCFLVKTVILMEENGMKKALVIGALAGVAVLLTVVGCSKAKPADAASSAAGKLGAS
jgi:hypothetical protein